MFHCLPSDIAHCTLGVENEYRENVVTVRRYYPRHTRLNKEIVRCTSYEYRYDRLWYATTKNKKQNGRLRLCGQDQKSRTHGIIYLVPGTGIYHITDNAAYNHIRKCEPYAYLLLHLRLFQRPKHSHKR